MSTNYYEILGVAENATQADIKQAYRKLSMEYHPDRNPDGEHKFKEINEAYQILSDPQKRSKYDRQKNGGFGGNDIFEDFFKRTEDIFSRTYRHAEDIFEQRRDNIPPLEVSLDLSIKDSALGAKKTVKYKRRSWCPNCASSRTTCTTCNGTGYITIVRGNNIFRMEETVACSQCSGSGAIRTKTPGCTSDCKDGYVLEDHEFSIDLPSGIFIDNILRVADKGHESSINKGKRGNVVIRLVDKPEENHERINNNIVITDTITYVELVTGVTKTSYMYNDTSMPLNYKVPKWFDMDSYIEVSNGPFQGGKTYIRLKLHIPKRDLSDEHLSHLHRICED